MAVPSFTTSSDLLHEDALRPWLERIEARQAQVRTSTGAAKLALSSAVARLLSTPRRMRVNRDDMLSPMQKPWFPRWPHLTSKPIHDLADFPWVTVLRQASADIRDEMFAVQARFDRAAYDSDINNKPWNTYYFYLQRRMHVGHLRACPRTAEALSHIPTNRLHVCFSAIQPGGHLAPHTGPTNTSLTVHLGLANCDGATLFVAGQAVPYQDGEVLIFDDSYVHWVEHTGCNTRCTLMITIWHPDLNPLERVYLAQVTKLIG